MAQTAFSPPDAQSMAMRCFNVKRRDIARTRTIQAAIEAYTVHNILGQAGGIQPVAEDSNSLA
jgi:hypothetical protein